jgi:hypothetical protein
VSSLRKGRKLLVVVFACAVLAAACGSDNKSDGSSGTTTKPKTVTDVPEGGTVTYASDQEPTGWNVNTVSQILYPCKQDPMATTTVAATPGWNEVFTWSSTSKRFWLNKDPSSNKPYNSANPAYCMRSPNTNGGYVTYATLCSAITASTTAAFTWTVNRDTGDVTTSYTIVDSYGRCLAAGPKNASNAAAYSSAVTTTCSGSSGQKWNAPPNLGSASLSDTAEVPNP